jgi:hypothetical protein
MWIRWIQIRIHFRDSFGICLTWVFSLQCCYVEIWFQYCNHANYTVSVSVCLKAVLRIRITLMRIWIRLITVMRIQMRIWILILM